jgi:N,N'-diacetyllegionaminate synthase
LKRVKIIAEAGVNHNGSIELAKKLIDVAVAAGADCVKFQTFKAENLVTTTAPKASYQIENTGNNSSQYEMLKKLELSYPEFEELKKYSLASGIEFISTPFDPESIQFLKNLGMPFFKVPSGEITNYLYLSEIAATKLPVVLSTGMATVEEIVDAVNLLRQHGYNADNLTILHCTTEYPAPWDEVNLKAMSSLAELLQLPVGYSDHTEGIEVSIAAVALGATIIEKHFTLDRNMEGPDHKASLEPAELKALVKGIRNIEQSMGDGKKAPTKHEVLNRPIARKSLVAIKPIKKDEPLTLQNVGTKRPGTGLSPMLWPTLDGKKSPRDFKQDELITL